MGAFERVRDGDVLLTPFEVSRMAGVNPKTVTRWASKGRIGFVRTLGGHRRYWRADVERLLADRTEETEE